MRINLTTCSVTAMTTAAATAVLTAGPASAAPKVGAPPSAVKAAVGGGLDPSTPPPIEVQQILSRMRPTAEALDELGVHSYADDFTAVSISWQTSTITLTLKEGSTKAEALLAAAPPLPDGIKIAVQYAPLNVTEVMRNETNVTDLGPDAVAFAGIALDGEHLEVGAVRDLTLAEQFKISALAGMPVTFRSSPKTVHATSNPKSLLDLAISRAPDRQNDTTPFKGGARLNGAGNERGAGYGKTFNCTSAFTAYNSSSNALYVFTAGHCFQWHTTVSASPSSSTGAPLGEVENVAYPVQGMDAESIRILPANGTISATYYDGPRYPTQDSKSGPDGSRPKQVNSAGNNVMGDTVCMSGSFSGVSCSIVVRSVRQSVGGGFYLDRGENTNKTAMVGNGDSGSPVFDFQGQAFDNRTNPDPPTRRMTGIISSITLEHRPCEFGEQANGRECSDTMFWSPAQDVMNLFGLTANSIASKNDSVIPLSS